MVSYFELYGLPENFHPGKDAVKKKYYELSRLYHPDRFAQAADADKTEALRMAAINNEAYKTLNDADATMAYILKQNGLLEEEEKYNLPPDFLMDMMDINEAVSEYELTPDNEKMKEQVTKMIKLQFHEWEQAVAPLTEKADAEPGNRELLLKIKDYYFRKKYLLRIQQRIDTFATR